MKKHIIEHYRTLPEPYRTQATTNFNDEKLRISPLLTKTETLYAALLHGFQWEFSPQGYQHWNQLAEGLILGERIEKLEAYTFAQVRKHLIEYRQTFIERGHISVPIHETLMKMALSFQQYGYENTQK